MIIWGGFVDTTTRTNTGARYVPSTDSWIPTSTGSNVPSRVISTRRSGRDPR